LQLARLADHDRVRLAFVKRERIVHMVISGKTILRAIAVAIFLATLPGAILRSVHSEDLYLFP
jgi:hypothetical protein